MTDERIQRAEGVDFTSINAALANIQYPMTATEFVAEYGDDTIERTNAGAITVRELFEGTGMDTFESPEEVRQSALNLMPEESVGRLRYSDRGGATPSDGTTDEDQSI
jgi:hypothetical protein